MTNVVISMKILPENPDIDLDKIYNDALPKLEKAGAIVEDNLVRKEIEPIAFGLKALKLRFLYPEEKGNPDALEDALKNIEGISEVTITDVRRAFG